MQEVDYLLHTPSSVIVTSASDESVVVDGQDYLKPKGTRRGRRI
ncbi:MAG: hypothetical protein ACRDL7_00160 [Gaiellaceae bacterium]